MSSIVAEFSKELSGFAEGAERSVLAVWARHRLPSSGIYWRQGVVVTAEHAVKRDDEISILLGQGKKTVAKLAGRDRVADIAVLKVEDSNDVAVPAFTDSSSLKLAQIVLALGRTRTGNLVASAGIIGGLSEQTSTGRSVRIDRNIRLDLRLYPGFSGGPLLGSDGKIVGMNTNGLGRGRPITIPVSTVDRTVNEILEKGYIARPYLGVAVQPVILPDSLRTKVRPGTRGGLMVLHVESGGPADKAGILMGDTIVELSGKPALDLEDLHDLLSFTKAGESLEAAIIRSNTVLQVKLTVGERPAR